MNISKETHSGTLPQSRTLEEQTADKQRSARNGFAQRGNNPEPTGVQHVRGERGGNVNSSPSPAKEKSDAASGVSRVFVLARNSKPLVPCKASRARILLKKGRAKVHSLYPFTIRLVDRIEGETQPVALKLDPGAKVTGVAIVRQDQKDQSEKDQAASCNFNYTSIPNVGRKFTAPRIYICCISSALCSVLP